MKLTPEGSIFYEYVSAGCAQFFKGENNLSNLISLENGTIYISATDSVNALKEGKVDLAVIIELKWDKSTVGALEQIREKNYGNALNEYQGKLLLVGINYNKKTKKHECTIEVMEKYER